MCGAGLEKGICPDETAAIWPHRQVLPGLVRGLGLCETAAFLSSQPPAEALCICFTPPPPLAFFILAHAEGHLVPVVLDSGTVNEQVPGPFQTAQPAGFSHLLFQAPLRSPSKMLSS